MSVQVHDKRDILKFGVDVQDAKAAAILLHGRGGSAQDMLWLAEEINTRDVAFYCPRAAQNRWYPNSAFAPLNSNEPDLSSALSLIDQMVEELILRGLTLDKIVIGGFSQGACLASEYVARNAREYGGLFVLSGALIGPEGTPRDYPGEFNTMPVFIGGSDVDPWVSYEHLVETAEVLKRMGANVDFRTYPGMAHTVNQDEIEAVRELLAQISQPQ